MRDNVRSALGPPWRVFLAGNGLEALQYASSMRAALVMLDFRMPRMDGLDACARIRALPHYATTPIVMLTAYDDEDMRQRAKQAGATTLFRKPFTIATLRAGLAPLLAASVDAAARGTGSQARADRRFDLAFSDNSWLTRDHEVLGVCREAESVVPPRRYANVAEAAAALRELSRR
jgi:CheY-like chemotaxis protein